MHRAWVVLALAVLPPSGVAAGTFGRPTTVPAAALEMPAREPPTLALRALKGAPAEERPGRTMVDWFPTPGGFRLTGGFRDADEASQRRGSFAPYLGFGWQGALLDDTVLVGLDFGAFIQGRPRVRVLSAGSEAEMPADGRRAIVPAALEPVVSITFTYRF